MTDMRDLFERQAAWQAGRRHLSWPEKVRIAEAMRESLAGFRKMRSMGPMADRIKRSPPPGG